LVRPKFSQTNQAKVGLICMVEIVLALRAKLSMPPNPLQLFDVSQAKTW